MVICQLSWKLSHNQRCSSNVTLDVVIISHNEYHERRNFHGFCKFSIHHKSFFTDFNTWQQSLAKQWTILLHSVQIIYHDSFFLKTYHTYSNIPLAVLSWPANMKVSTSSLISASVNPSPSSSFSHVVMRLNYRNTLHCTYPDRK